MLLARRIRVERGSLIRVLEVIAIPAVVVVGHLAWLRLFNGVPKDQAGFTEQLLDLGARDGGLLVGRLAFVELMYAGLFVLPVAIGALRALPTAVKDMSRRAWIPVAGIGAVLLVGFGFFQGSSRRMPYVPSWFTPSGLGADGILGNRSPILQPWVQDLLTWVVFVATIVSVLVVGRALCDRSQPKRPEALLLVVIIGAMALGALAPSAVFFDAISLDRYLLPMAPFAIALGVWACQRLRVWRVALILSTVLMAAFSVVATRDGLEFHSALWALDRSANARGVANDQLDGGAGWTRYHLAGRGERVAPYPGVFAPWWVAADDRTSAEYVVSSERLPGYAVVSVLPYSQWLQTGRSLLYLQRKLPAVPTRG
jgi:hypothetical protein